MALNLFHLTASPPFQKVGFFHLTAQPQEGGGRLVIIFYIIK
jgi:hypothetical protein